MKTVKKSKCKSRIEYSSTCGGFGQTCEHAGMQELCPSLVRGAWRAAAHGVAESGTRLSVQRTTKECDAHRCFSSKRLETHLRPTDTHQDTQRRQGCRKLSPQLMENQEGDRCED